MAKKVIRRTRKEVFKRWIAALRSGEYEQGQNWLRQGDKFCCLGVLCDLARKDGGPKWSNEEGPAHYDGQCGLPPTHMLAFLGLGPSIARNLSSKNDNGATFKTIADHIEMVVMPAALAKP